ncbi:hypothetical protein CERSUDRAFT_119661 [Gelatoporia subvermispora B]|uniref:DUF6533 domain-containing protein n=1 Tax=Ceriporiopsis subvermispora (strain B) TaxID=914234 RepID=M2Q490_CERS8|nr:hypothetical protein CERSUDRAFT_119661 [Gelatoporia subvermispora B]
MRSWISSMSRYLESLQTCDNPLLHSVFRSYSDFLSLATMSIPYGQLADQISSYVNNVVIANYCIVASAVLVLYDHICTLPQELQLIWGRKLTSTMMLFHANRLLILVYAILNIVQASFRPGAAVSCTMLWYTLYALDLCLFALWAAFSGIRVYALSGGSRLLSLAVILLSLVPVGTNAYGGFFGNSWQTATFPVLGLQCLDSKNISETTTTRLAISTRVPVIIADIMVLILTWWKTWATVRMVREHNVKTPLMTLLLRDGTLYFIGLLSINLLNIVGRTTNVFVYAGGFSTQLSAIIITHFLLNLRQLAHGSPDDTSRQSSVRDGQPDAVRSRTSSLRFGSFVGNMGESLVHGSEDNDRDVAWDDDSQDAVNNTRLDAQTPDASAARVCYPLPEEVMENERQADQAADVGSLV